MVELTGRKGGSQTNTSDNLFSTDNVEVILAISEGPIKGLKDGPSSFYVGDTQVTSPDGTANIPKYLLQVNQGGPSGENIKSRLGGFGSSTQVGVNLLKDQPVVRTGSVANIDYIDIRGNINALFETNKNGTFGAELIFKIEYKPVSASTWVPATSASPPPEVSYDGNSTTYVNNGSTPGVTARHYVKIAWSTIEPTDKQHRDIWFDANEFIPYLYSGETNSWINSLEGYGFIGESLPYTASQTGHRFIYKPGTYWSEVRDILGADAHIGDVIYDVQSGNILLFNGSTWVSPSQPYDTVNHVSGGGVTATGQPGASLVGLDGVVKISGKTTSTYVRELRIPVPRINEPYMIRLTKLSRDSKQEGETTYGNSLYWESFQEVTGKEFNFPNVATVQFVAQASGQFSSVPDFSGIYDGRLVKVPTNYNPVTRTYTGVWDGLWKVEWTNNPAFIVKDLVENDLYGMNAYYPVVLDSTSVYLAGQHCDQYGFRFNGIIADSRLGKEAVNYLCGLFGGRFVDDGNGYARILLDRSTDAVYLFAAENVVDGVFTYSMTEIASRFNDVTVTFINPDLNWQEDRVRVYDTDSIAKYGRIPTDFIAVGCTSREEAIRRGRLHMITALTEKTMVNFKTNRAGLYLEPYDIILISDETNNTGISGRVVERVHGQMFNLRDPVHLEPGFTYKARFQQTTPSLSVLEFNVQNSSGTTSQITVDGILPEHLVDTVVTFATVGGTGAPKAFRIIGIEETEHPDNITISAIEVNRTKWDFVMTGIIDDGVDDGGPKIPQTAPPPVTNLELEVKTRDFQNRKAQDLLATWGAPATTQGIKYYAVYRQLNSGPIERIAVTPSTQFEVVDVAPAIWRIGVASVSLTGAESSLRWAEHDFIGATNWIPVPKNLRLTNGDSDFVFNVLTPRFEWEIDAAPFVAGFNVELRDVVSGTTFHRVNLDKAVQFYEYDYARNKEQNAGVPRRDILIAVQTVTDTGATSDWAYLNIYNPQIDPPQDLQFKLLPYSFRAEIPTPSALDFKGVRIYAGASNPPTTLVYDGKDLNYQGLVGENETVYVQVAYYDNFRDDDAVKSKVFVTTGTGLQPGTISWEHLKKDLYQEINFNPYLQKIADYTSTVRERIIDIKSQTDQNIATVSQTVEARTGPTGSLTQIITDSQSKIGNTIAARTLIENVTQATVAGDSLAAIIQTLGSNYGTVKTTVGTHTDQLGQVTNRFVVNMQTRGTSGQPYISGFGMVQATGTNLANPTSTFAIAADNFVIGPASTVPSNSPDWNAPVPLLNFDTVSKTFALNGSLIVTNGSFANSSLSGAKLQPGTIAADRLIAGSITANELAAGAVTAPKIAAGSITAEKIDANAITADKILAREISTDKIKINGVQTENLFPNAATWLTANTRYGLEAFGSTTLERSVHNHGFAITNPGGAMLLLLATASLAAGDGSQVTLFRLYLNGVVVGTCASRQGAPPTIQVVLNRPQGNYALSLTAQGVSGSNGLYTFDFYTLSVFQSIR